MKNNQEIADLIFKDPDSMEPIVRIIHMNLVDFLKWIQKTKKNQSRTHSSLNILGIPHEESLESSGRKIYEIIKSNKEDILKSFNSKFFTKTNDNAYGENK